MLYFASEQKNNTMDLIKAQTLANELMGKHGITQKGWTFKFDTAKRRFGSCRHRSKIITLSKHLTQLNDEHRVRNTILHEIAHALTKGHGHDSVWKAKAIEIGCDGERCYSTASVSTPESKYIAICKGCGHKHKKHRKSRGISSCGFCSGGSFNAEYQLNFVINPKFLQ